MKTESIPQKNQKFNLSFKEEKICQELKAV